jgi:hypothetical protein|tara:strand:+ start:4878 stop:6236 length:1359 start_codon:yes stop_codon:yes gene_type:complete
MIVKEEVVRSKIRKIILEKLNEVGAMTFNMPRTSGASSSLTDINFNIDDLPKGDGIGKTDKFVFQSVPCSRAASVAKEEGTIWDDGNIYERDTAGLELIDKYWRFFGKNKDFWENGRGSGKMHHWSAVFVSWVMSHDDGNVRWDKSTRHSVYLDEKCWNRRKEVDSNPDSFKDQIVYLAFAGEELIPGGQSSPKGSGEFAGNGLIQPGDVIGVRKRDGTSIHMDVYVGDGKKVGGNTGGGRGRNYCPPGEKESSGKCGTSGVRAANLNRMTDVIKRVKILGSLESFNNQTNKSGLPLGEKLNPNEFKRVYGPIMKEAVKGTPIFASVKLAQMALETGWGKSTIANANNLFGIKGSGSSPYWDGTVQKAETEEVYDGKRGTYNLGFRKYKSPYDSIKDHNHLLMTKSRYKPVREAKTPEDQAYALQEAGYATGEKYAETLISIINDYGFKDLD